MALEQLHSLEAAALKLGGISIWTLRSWIRDGRLHATKVGARVMLTESELERFVLSSNAPKAKADPDAQDSGPKGSRQ
jgi:excisionase family DNA binding protein